MEHITAAGNTEIPAHLVLRDAGFEITVRMSGDNEMWIATQGDLSLSAPSPLQLLGLHSMRKEREAAWKAPDSEINCFLNRFYPGTEKPA